MKITVEEDSENQTMKIWFRPEASEKPDCELKDTPQRLVAFSILRRSPTKIMLECRGFSFIEDYDELNMRLSFDLPEAECQILRTLSKIDFSLEQANKLARLSSEKVFRWLSAHKLLSTGPFSRDVNPQQEESV